VRVALVKKHRFARVGGDFQLRDEGGALRFGRREISAIVQAAFADGDHAGLLQQILELRIPRDIGALCVMRMHAGGARQIRGMGGGQCRGLARACQVGSGNDLAPHAGLERACNHGVTIRCKAVVGKIRPDVN